MDNNGREIKEKQGNERSNQKKANSLTNVKLESKNSNWNKSRI